MSSVTMCSMPVSPATCRLAITPPVGPETSIWMGALAAASSVISPPFDLMITVCAATAPSSSRRRISRSCRDTTGLR